MGFLGLQIKLSLIFSLSSQERVLKVSYSLVNISTVIKVALSQTKDSRMIKRAWFHRSRILHFQSLERKACLRKKKKFVGMVIGNPYESNQSEIHRKSTCFERALLAKVRPTWPTRGGGFSRCKGPLGSQLPAGS